MDGLNGVNMKTNSYRFFMPSKLIFEVGVIGRIGDYLAELKSKRVLIVTDQGLMATGLIDRINQKILDSGQESIIFSEVKPNPTVGNVHRGSEIIEQENIDTIVAVGGGSSIDAAKAISALSENKGSIRDYELGKSEFTRQGPPLIVIPTTAGTGSEATMAAVIMDEDVNRKFDIVSRFMAPSVALVDPEATYSLPASMTAFTGMDALTHAIEGYTATLAGPLTDTIHLKAITLLWENLAGAVRDGKNTESRERVMMGSMMAGIGFPNSGLGAVHGLSYALGCKYNLGHGLANAILLPHVMRFNQSSVPGRMEDISRAIGLKNTESEFLIEELQKYQREIGVPELSSFDIDPSDFPAMAEESIGEYSNCNTNPRTVGVADAITIYRNAASL
jgi:alcohol dehydrogenase